MKSKHTPGPWVLAVGGLNKNNCFAIQSDDGWLVGYTIPRVKIEKQHAVPIEPTEEDRANGRLIAAAPDLLDACRCALASLIEIAEDHDINHISTIRELQEAITKAEEC